ncbi:hypothetical protein DFP94_101848 [Fontibacillus phaseoli]|uniref:Uncharacterized protein n=1 Tax=Fontibacillus phaseoli TaxID=1416533 RepID=A0A369BPE8_9BACL|nr:hypothetical protein [Fontibacillus phaseoli]RCX23251.1 hypothetical protein DFP94_101848 [Fontibacillus phaseoli]
MKAKWMVRCLLFTIGSALLLAIVTRAGGPIFENSRLASAETFLSEKPVELSDDNLVDGLSELKLPVPIAKVDLNGAVLSVDLKVTEDRFDKGELYRGIAEMISFSFERTTNIDQLLLRLVAEDRWLGKRYLLLAADVRRGEWPESALYALRTTGNMELPKELRTWFRVTETQLWKSGVN